MTERTTVCRFLPRAQSWEPGAEVGTASNAVTTFSHFTLAASQGKTRELAPGLGSEGQKKGGDRRLRPAALCCPSRAPRLDSKSSTWLWSGDNFVHSERRR